MAGREVREYTNLTDPKDKKWGGKGKERIDDEEITFQRMVAKAMPLGRCINVIADVSEFSPKMQEVAGERGGYLHGRGALDSDDLLYLKEQMEAEEDAERLLRRTEKRAFAAFKKAVADTSPASVPLPLRVEPKPKSGIRQQDLLKRVVEVKPKRQRMSNTPEGRDSSVSSSFQISNNSNSEADQLQQKELSSAGLTKELDEPVAGNPVKSLLVAYESSEDED